MVRDALRAPHHEGQPRTSLQLLVDLVERGLHASLVLCAARCTRCAGCTDDLVTDLDWQRALVGDDVGQMDQAQSRISLEALDQRARGRTERARGVSFAEAVLDRVRTGVVAAHLSDDLAV